jgi:uncharacterized protein YdhG (YjbR/CyaY superfamily)
MKKVKGFTDEEKAAMRGRAQELMADKKDGEGDVLEAIEKMTDPQQRMPKRLHILIKKTAPTLTPKTWYGFPAYANKQGKVVCFFQYAGKFKTRYATLGFSDSANLDEGNMWSVTFAIKKLTPAEEVRIVELVKKAVS